MTVTLGLAYLAVYTHEQTRRAQAQQLRTQAFLLNGILEPTPLPPPQSRAELAREERSSLVETAKDRWNSEVEHAVRYVQRTDWAEVSEGMQGAVARLLGGGLQKSREGIEEVEKQAGPRVQEAVDKSKAAANRGLDEAAAGINKAAAKTTAGAEKLGAEIKEGASRASVATKEGASKASAATKEQLHQAGVKAHEARDVTAAETHRLAANARTGAHDAAESIKHSGGTIDAARGVVRDIVQKGVEKGKEAIGMAQAAVGLATEKIESKAAGLGPESDVEKALRQRYERPKIEKTVEQALVERYTPIDAKDNTKLRGV